MNQNIEHENEEQERRFLGSQKTIDRRLRRSFNRNDRKDLSVTDKYWWILFILVLTSWIVSSSYAHRHQSKINYDNDTATNESLELAPLYLWGKSWLFDTVTCNLAFFRTHYEKNGSIVMWANVLYCVLLIVYSVSLMRNNNMFHSQLGIACLIFIAITLFHRWLMSATTLFLTLRTFGFEKVGFWVIPEAILGLVWYTKKAYTDDKLKRYADEMLIFHDFYWLLVPSIVYILGVYIALIEYTSDIVGDSGCDCAYLTYVIIGGSCYLGLTLFYLFLMAISRSVDVALKEYHKNIITFSVHEVFYSIGIVLVYHFGTVCYHATLIFPRLATLFVKNEPEFKQDEKFSKITNRFRIAQCQIHNLSLMSTGVGGTNHSESLRKLFRCYTSDLKSRLEHFQGFSRIGRSLSALLLAINSLMLILLWTHGLDDPKLSLATWIFYIRLMIVFNIAMKVCDAISDTTLLYLELTPFTYCDLFTKLFVNHSDENIIENILENLYQI